MRQTLLIDFLSTCQYEQNFFIYETNDYDQNVLLSRGTIEDIRNDEFGLEYLTCVVETWRIREDGTLFILIEGNHPERPRQKEYSEEYVAEWDNLDPDTRPWLYSAELDYFGHDIYGSSEYLREYGRPYNPRKEENNG